MKEDKFRELFPNKAIIDVESGVRIANKLDLELVRNYLLGYREGTQKSVC